MVFTFQPPFWAGLSGYIAELGSAFLCSALSITPTPRADHASYIAHWLDAMKADKKAIFTAAAKASEAVRYLQRVVESAH